MNKKDEFKPYIPADRVMPELTVTSIIMGVLLAVIFGAANAYLGLRVGMTVSASIPQQLYLWVLFALSCVRIPSLKVTWYRPSVQPVSHLQQERSLRCRHCSSGQKRVFALCRALSRSH